MLEEPPSGIEPETSSLPTRRSAKLSYGGEAGGLPASRGRDPELTDPPMCVLGAIRTPDTRLRRAVLYPLSYEHKT